MDQLVQRLGMLRVGPAVLVVLAVLGEEVVDVELVVDCPKGQGVQVVQGELPVRPGGDVDVAAAAGGGDGHVEDAVEGAPEGVDGGFPVGDGREDGGDCFEGDWGRFW